MRKEYKEFIKEAKRRKIKTEDDLYDLSLEDGYDSLTGGEFECAKKSMKIK
jgi:hypothetical protein